MKRSSDRDTPPRSKRSRSSMGRYDDSSDERITPDRIRRRGSRARSPSPRARYVSPHRDEYLRPPERSYPYKVLCVSALHPKASDEVIKDTLYREYKKYGDLSIRITHDLDERVAYVCFRNPEDARDAKHGKPRIIIYDKVALVEAVYEVPRTNDVYRSRPRSISPDYDLTVLRLVFPCTGNIGARRFPHLTTTILPDPPFIMVRSTCPRLTLRSPRHSVPRPPFEKQENKKDKFPNYLHHIQPEDDPLATRTLFAGNLEINITEEELRRILIWPTEPKWSCLVSTSGSFNAKSVMARLPRPTRIWVGGLGPWTSIPQLEREFDRFGAIKKIDYVKGDNQALILYDSIDAAQAAVKEMRGFPLGGPERRLRTDFADVTPGVTYRPKPPYTGIEDYRGREVDYEYDYDGGEGSSFRGYRGRPYPERRAGSRGPYRYPEGAEDEWGRTREGEYDRRRSGSRGIDRSRSRSPRRSPDSDSDSGSRRAGLLASSRTLPEVARKCTTVWQGALILKNSLFPSKFHLIDGDTDIVDGLMKDEEGKHQLRITQRLRLDQPKLEDVQKRISSASSHAIFLGLAGSTASVTNDDTTVQTRPLRNLVSYLKQKEAAGVISLLNKETEATGVLYSFPPCPFSTELLKRTCPNLSDEAIKEDHLVIVVEIGDQR
ncbi:hypothetical protein NQ318_018534 [Aromia moschata]|uniref:RNA-binding protein spenito n=1 Tax=Aromia moschata TaxID=1265417 RepID=A0AAV8ZGL2_9CUCU|nr:hypothetical protein NQ318_018534 [Aromia moschata]